MSIPPHRLSRLRQSANVPPQCLHVPSHPVYRGGNIVYWQCSCGFRKSTDEYTERLTSTRKAVRGG